MNAFKTLDGGRWEPETLAFVEGLSLTRKVLTLSAICQEKSGALWPNAAETFDRVSLNFEGISGLKLTGWVSGLNQVMGFYIDDLTGRQLEGLAFEVGDYEDGRISFLARGFTAEVIEQSVQIHYFE